MPYYRKKRSKGYARPKRKTYRARRYNRSKGYTSRVRNTNVFPRRMITRLKYSDTLTMSLSGTGFGMTTNLWNLNGLYDPDAQTGGHQPYGFDEAMALYSRYRVYKTKWRITVAPSSDMFTFTVCPQNGAGNPTGQQQSVLAERPMAVTKMTSAGSVPLVFKGSSYLPKLNGTKSSEYKTDDRFYGTASGNPAEVIPLVLGASSIAPFDIQYTITLIFYAEFYDPNIVAQS